MLSVSLAALTVLVDGKCTLSSRLLLELLVILVVLRDITELLALGALQADDLTGSFFLFCHERFLELGYCITPRN